MQNANPLRLFPFSGLPLFPASHLPGFPAVGLPLFGLQYAVCWPLSRRFTAKVLSAHLLVVSRHPMG